MEQPFTLGVCQVPVTRTAEEMISCLEKIAQPGPGLLLLPELALGGFDYTCPDHWAEQSTELMDRLVGLGRKNGLSFMASLWEKRDGLFFNALKLAGPDGLAHLADKYHLFPLSGEAEHFAPGKAQARCVALGPARVAGAVCFDLRFPEVFRAHAAQEVNVLAVCAQWPLSRLNHLQILLRARAVENQAYVLFANACLNAPGLGPLAGHSSLIGPDGQVIFELGQAPATRHSVYDPKVIRLARQHFDTRHSCFGIEPAWD